jgi:hypothetical protein
MFAVIVNCFFVLRLRSRKRSLCTFYRTTTARCRKRMSAFMQSDSYFCQTLATAFPTVCSINLKYKIWRKFEWWASFCSMQTERLQDRRTEIHEGANKKNRIGSAYFRYTRFILSVVGACRLTHWSRYVTKTKFSKKKFSEAKLDGFKYIFLLHSYGSDRYKMNTK